MYDTNITQNNFMKGKVKGYYKPGGIAAIELCCVVLVYVQILF
jgi:hypothetical protein